MATKRTAKKTTKKTAKKATKKTAKKVAKRVVTKARVRRFDFRLTLQQVKSFDPCQDAFKHVLYMFAGNKEGKLCLSLAILHPDISSRYIAWAVRCLPLKAARAFGTECIKELKKICDTTFEHSSDRAGDFELLIAEHVRDDHLADMLRRRRNAAVSAKDRVIRIKRTLEGIKRSVNLSKTSTQISERIGGALYSTEYALHDTTWISPNAEAVLKDIMIKVFHELRRPNFR